MDPSDLEISGEDDNIEDNSSSTEKSKSDNEGNDLPTSVEKNSNKTDDQDQKKPNETEDSGAVEGASKNPDQSETGKIQESATPIGASRKRSSYKISPMLVKIIKHSQSRLSTASTEAHFGSSSSSSTSSGEELVEDLEEVGELYESADASGLAPRILDPTPTEVKNKSKSSPASFSGTDVVSEPRTSRVFASADESFSVQEDSSKPPEMSASHHVGSVPSTTESTSSYSKKDEMSSKASGRVGYSLLKISKMVESPPMEIEVLSDSSSATSSAGTDVVSESQTTNLVFAGVDESSSLQEDSPHMSTDNQADDAPSTTMESPSNDSETEMDFTTTLTSSEFSEIERMDTSTASPMPGQASSSHTREGESSRAHTDCGATSGFYDYDYDLKNDKSVRRKIKAVTPVVPDANLPPTKSSPTADSRGSRRAGRLLLRMSQKMEETSIRGDDRNIFDAGYDSARNFGSKTWLNELLNLCTQTGEVNRNSQLDTQSLLEEVRRFFQRNPVVADESLSWRETKRCIMTSKYLSDEFARDHGLLPFEELMRRYVEELENYASAYRKNQLRKMQYLCRLLQGSNISERNLIDYCEDCTLIPIGNRACSSSDQRSSLNDEIRRRLLWLAEEIGWDTLIDLYRKVSTEGMSFDGLVWDSEISEASVTATFLQGASSSSLQSLRFCDSDISATSELEEISRHRESPSPSQSSSRTLVILVKPQETEHETPSEDKSGNFDPSSGNERDLTEEDEPMEESEEYPNIIPESYSEAIEGNEPCNETVPLLPNEAMESNSGENAGEDGSTASAQNAESEPDKTISEE